MADIPINPTDRRALLAGIGALAAGTILSVSRAEAGSLTPPGPPSPTGKPLAETSPGNAVAPIVQATTNPAFISGNTYGGNLGSTDPNANFTH